MQLNPKYNLIEYADMAELVASSPSAAGGRINEDEKVQRSKSLIYGTANRLAGAADNAA